VKVHTAPLRFPRQRVLLARTRLAYVHLRNLLTDAKRDRAARVYGYVAIWLPEELLLLFLQEGDVVNATNTVDGVRWAGVAIKEALARVPNAAEYGEVLFHEAPDEQLACMHHAQLAPPVPWPSDADAARPAALGAHLAATMFDGVVEVQRDHAVSYLLYHHGLPRRVYSHDGVPAGPDAAAAALLADGARIRRFAVPPPLPVQAAPPLIEAYRVLVRTLVARLTADGADGAPAVAEQARRTRALAHPVLAHLALGDAGPDPVTTTAELTAAVAAWITDLLWSTASAEPEAVLREVTRDRRHLFHSAGLFAALPWTVPK
jgi:hypothetical protein